MKTLFAILAAFMLVAPLVFFGIQYIQYRAYRKKRDTNALSEPQQAATYASAQPR